MILRDYWVFTYFGALWQQSDGSVGHLLGNLHAIAYSKIDLPTMHLRIAICLISITTPVHCVVASPSPGCSSVDNCSIDWNLCQLIPCLVAVICLEGCFLDFHFVSYLANQPIPHSNVIAASARERRRYKNAQEDEWDSDGQWCATIFGLLVIT